MDPLFLPPSGLIFQWDILLIVFLSLICIVAFTVWMAVNRYRVRYIVAAWLGFLLILSAGFARAVHEEETYHKVWTEVLLGITRSFVSTTELMEHCKITRETKPDDPIYRNLLKVHAAWCRDIPMVAYVFTLRLRDNETEKVDWILSCESDINQDGKIEGKDEVGEGLYEPYDEWFPVYGQGFGGTVALDEHVYSEEYHGYFVTAVAPLRGEDGSIEAILGVDFRADFWNTILAQIRTASMQLLLMLLSIYFLAIWSIAVLHRAFVRVTKANEELLAAQKAAGAAAKAKSDFLANMSHEIRTPMNALLGFTDILTQRIQQNCSKEEREDSEGILEIIRKSGQDLLTIINDILDFSRIEANLLQVESVPLSIKQVLENVWQMEMPNVVAKHLNFSIKYKEPIPELILGDPVRLRQILVNLIGNAIKFTEQGSVTVQCEATVPTCEVSSLQSRSGIQGNSSIIRHDARDPFPSSAVLRIDVIDTGIGIEQKQMEKLFKPFSQIDMSTTRMFGGSGLGLGIAKRLAKLMDGDITATSTPGIGSTFSLHLHVYLPTEEQSTAMLEKKRREQERSSSAAISPSGSSLSSDSIQVDSARKDSSGASPERPLRNARILLVEDMLVNQIVISTQLRDAGAKVEIAGNGEIGVQKINRDMDNGLFFDVVLMDMQMPVMDGYEATMVLRQQGYTRPIVAITAHALTGDREKTIQAGCDDYIAKPVDRQILIETIKSYLH